MSSGDQIVKFFKSNRSHLIALQENCQTNVIVSIASRLVWDNIVKSDRAEEWKMKSETSPAKLDSSDSLGLMTF